MAVKNSKNNLRKQIKFSFEVKENITYADYFLNKSVFKSVRLSNDNAEEVKDVTLSFRADEPLLISNSYPLETLPFESSVEISVGNILSPLYLAETEEIKSVKITAELSDGNGVFLTSSKTVNVLPFAVRCGAESEREGYATLIRPGVPECNKIVKTAKEQLERWDFKSESLNYKDNDKNSVRLVAASVYSALKSVGFEREECDNLQNVTVRDAETLISQKKATPLELAMLACAALERIGLNSLLLISKNSAAVGVWLYDGCFLNTSDDDFSVISNYVSDGINNLSCFSAEDLYSSGKYGYSHAESRFSERLESDEYLLYVDIKRCRIAGFKSLPLKIRNEKGFEIVKAEEYSFESKPVDLPSYASLKTDSAFTKNKQWERRLLDLSLKNSLLNFNLQKGVLKIISDGGEATLERVKGGELTLKAISPEFSEVAPVFKSSSQLKRHSQLIYAENTNGLLRTFSDEENLNEVLNRLLKKSKSALEESGCKILYLSFGLLKWSSREDGKEKYAPVCLLPVSVKKNKGNSAYAVSVQEDGLQVNSTLLEFLKREFNIDVRGLDGNISSLTLTQILAMVRSEISVMKGWDISDDVFLAVFSFARLTMWKDVRENIEEFKKNEMVRSLLTNKNSVEEKEVLFKDEDGASASQTLTPLPCDSSQFEAVSYSQTGNTFVLHGPPGTGKSQTITNMIANAVYDGKQVLFVAEKQAALEVVKKRLDNIGLGDFCLELHSSKTGKTEVLKKLADTLKLKEEEEASYSVDAKTLDGLKKLIEDPHSALHKKRNLGLSIYEGVMNCLKTSSAPTVLNIENSFYDSLTKDKMFSYEQMLTNTASAARECGSVSDTPFSNVNLTEYSLKKRDEVYCASKVMLNEMRHLKNYVSLFLELFRQKIVRLTLDKLDNLKKLNEMLLGDLFSKYYKCTEEEFSAFFKAERRLTFSLQRYDNRFSSRIKFPSDAKEYCAQMEACSFTAEDIKSKKLLYKTYKSLSSRAKKAFDGEEDIKNWLTVVGEISSDIYELERCVYKGKITNVFGKLDYGKKEKFTASLKAAHALAEKVFMDYNADSFNSCCIRTSNGFALSALEGLKNSLFSFEEAKNTFNCVTNADVSKISGDELLEYYSVKSEALIENIDKLSCWCLYKKNIALLDGEGLKFIGENLENGRFTSENILDGFRKNVYTYFVETNVAADPVLSSFSAAVLEDNIEKYRLMSEEYSRDGKDRIRRRLISALPTRDEEDGVALEIAYLQRAFKSGGRGLSLREIFANIPNLLKRVAPCLLMSPITVSQYLEPKANLYDTVIFDEASQMPTSEAVPALARAKSAVIVGDPKQLPPTSFFSSVYVDEENLESEDMESVLDDALALGLSERYLTWHYRSKHESLIAFSNIMYYENKLCTFPSPDSLNSRVRFVKVDGEYERGGKKRNVGEAAKLIAEVVRRLSDPVLSKESIGVVTFSNVQKEYIERKLAQTLAQRKLEDIAFDREEPLFIKNLENVQGDERDVILFSTCYGPDSSGRLSLNFGPINQTGGWRRLNVAVSRARSEMVVFSSMTSSMIDLSRTSSKGVAGLKAFLEFAEKGRTSLAINSANVLVGDGMGKYIAEELSRYGYECRYDVGVSGFKIDVAVVDPKNRDRFVLAILLDGSTKFSVRDRNVLQIQTLKRNNWNVLRLFTVNYFANPKREIKKIKELLDRLTSFERRESAAFTANKRAYSVANLEQRKENSAFITGGENDTEIISRMRKIVETEQPVSDKFLVKRVFNSLGVAKPSLKAESRVRELLRAQNIPYREICSEKYRYFDEDRLNTEYFRVESDEVKVRKSETDVTAFEILALVKAALSDRVSLRIDEIEDIVTDVFELSKTSELFTSFISDVINYGENQGVLVRSVTDRISLA